MGWIGGRINDESGGQKLSLGLARKAGAKVKAYPLWLRYLAGVALLSALSALTLRLGDGGGLTAADALKYVTLVGSLAFVGRVLWRIQERESNLYYGNFLSELSLIFASRRTRLRSTFIALGAILVCVAFLCFTLASLIYALASDGVYNPFNSAPGLGEVYLFVIDQALKGALFDFMEIFSLDLTNLAIDANDKWFFGAFLVVFRLFFSFIVIGAFIAYVLNRALQLAGYRIALS
jgi:hypothetical protein